MPAGPGSTGPGSTGGGSTSSISTGDSSSGQGLAAFRHSGFRLFQLSRFLIIVATEMQSVAVGWQIYATTKRALDLGLVGLAQFLPSILLFLISGHVADRFDRKRVMVLCYVGFAVCSAL